MFISHLEIKKLYGLIDKKLDFREDINLLIGINGSGKTSVLNVINWLLVPSWKNLLTTEFESLKLEFQFENIDYVLFCKQHKDEVTIDIEDVTNGKKYNQVQADIAVPVSRIKNKNKLRQSVRSENYNLSPEDHEVETWELLFDKIPNPVVIGLDRNLYTESGDEFTYLQDQDSLISRRIKQGKVESPLTIVKKLSSQIYTEYQNNVIELNKRLKDKIMLSSFDLDINEGGINNVSKHEISLEQIIELEDQVKEYFEEYIIGKREEGDKFYERSIGKINNYFKNLKSVVSKSELNKDNMMYFTYVNQFKKTNQLIDEFEKFEKNNKRYYETIKVYLDAVNSFLKDSAKEIYFDKTNSTIKYRVFNKANEVIEEGNDVENLSSGEKQILILFTYIKFNDKLGKIFIIDEPELSLHPKWQESFLEQLKKIMPDQTQLLFATHSPAIVGKNRKYTNTLLPY